MVTYSMMASTLKKLTVSKNTQLNELIDLQIAQQDNVSSYYIPFDYISKQAKIVLIGITPGKTQLLNALTSAQEAINQQYSDTEILKYAKEQGAFSGNLRNTLIELLDYIGLNKKLDIITTASLFNEHAHLVHTTSILRHPTFVNGQDYNGSRPDMLKHPIMLEQINTYLIDEIRQLPNALYIPLGSSVSKVFEKLIKDGLINENQVLIGLPHPSGANNGRIAYFLGKKTKDSIKKNSTTNTEKIDLAKKNILQKISLLTF